MSLWSEIKQRRITQIVLTYLVGGWIATTVVSEVVDREVLPLVVYEVALTLYLVGILAALIIGWYHGEKGEQKAPLREVVMLGVVALIGLGASGLVVRSAMREATLRNALIEAGTDLRDIGVLYFQDVSADGSMQAVAEGITEGLISSLSAVPELNVASRNAARAARGLDPDSAAHLLDVGTVVDGTVDQVREELRVTVRVLEGESGVVLARESYTWPAEQVAEVETELATEVARTLREQLGVELRIREGRASAPNSEAWLRVARAERLMKEASEALGRGDGEAMWEAYQAADAELVQAQAAAPEWAEPLVLRSEIAYESWRLTGTDEEFLETLAEAVTLADSALMLEPDNPDALELRGTALYRRWLQALDEEGELDAMLLNAQNDLERALALDRGRASANSTLSHLYYQVGEWGSAVIAAQRAYEEDAFLTSIDQVLRRLFLASYDMGSYEDARDWCLEGYRRFPDNFWFVRCQIQVMTMPDADLDIAEAWRLYEEMVPKMPEGGLTPALQAITQTFIGGVIGLAGLPDSANAVFERARLPADEDPGSEQKSMEAAMRSVIGDTEGAIERLQRFIIEEPEHSPGEHWWWDNLEGDPRFERLQAR